MIYLLLLDSLHIRLAAFFHLTVLVAGVVEDSVELLNLLARKLEARLHFLEILPPVFLRGARGPFGVDGLNGVEMIAKTANGGSADEHKQQIRKNRERTGPLHWTLTSTTPSV